MPVNKMLFQFHKAFLNFSSHNQNSLNYKQTKIYVLYINVI